MKNRNLLLILPVLAWLLWPHNIIPNENKNVKPNVILIILDDVGYGDLGIHGNPYLKSPNIDRLHSQSIRLTNYHVSPTCSPTRAALLTGRYNNRTGVWHTIMGRSLLRKYEVTMGDVFKANGYRTSMFGKWHLGDNYPFRPQDRGFDETVIHPAGGIIQGSDYWGNDYFDDTYIKNGKLEKFNGYCTDIWFDEALNFIENNKDNPFFCYISTNAAHWPFIVDEKFSEPYKELGLSSPLAEFYGMISNIDFNVGKLLERIDQLGISDNTIVIYTTDNGGDPAGTEGRYNYGMREFKGSQYDGGHRVPCFIRWPNGKIKTGENIDKITAHIDLLPTLIDLCGIEKPNGISIDGRSLVPLLRGNHKDWPDRILITDSQRVDHPIKWRKCAVMTDQWRLIDGNKLYNTITDPSQKINIADSNKDVVTHLREAYEEWWKDISTRFDEYCSIIIGSEEENPICLTSHDIHGKVIWNHRQIKGGGRADGFWSIDVERDGKYEIALRRWPKELNLPINYYFDDLDTDEFPPIVATDARLKIGNIDEIKNVSDKMHEVKFIVQLRAGKTKMQAWFINGRDDGQTWGAYYAYVKKNHD